MQKRLFAGCIAALLPLSGPALADQTGATSTTTPPVVATAATPAQDPAQRIVCRRVEVTGSLARRERVCKTAAEWQRLGDRGNEMARETVDWGRTRPSGGN